MGARKDPIQQKKEKEDSPKLLSRSLPTPAPLQRPVFMNRGQSVPYGLLSNNMRPTTSHRRTSVATSTPFTSEKSSWRWWHEDQQELAQEIETWKYNTAAQARVVVGRRASTRTTRRRASYLVDPKDDATTNGDFLGIPDLSWTDYGSLELRTCVVILFASLLTAVGVERLLLQRFYYNHDVPISLPQQSVHILVLTLILAVISALVVQEYGYSPDKKTVEYLVEHNLLPSPFSKVDAVEIRDTPHTFTTLNVHYLHATGKNPDKSTSDNRIDAIYCNHGFGASSLSWLPILRRLSQFASHVLAHDTVGFGLTSRPNVDRIGDLHRYGFSFSAGIGLALLERTLSQTDRLNVKDNDINNNTKPRRVVILGHSMGALVALRMALELPATTEIQVILIAPCVVGLDPTHDTWLRAVWDRVSNLWGMFLALCLPWFRHLRMVLVDPPCYFVFKRIIACKAFWSTLLQGFWGIVKPLSESDVQRYRWPSLVEGCVQGVIHFLRSQPFRHGFLSYPGGDVQLLADVLNRRNITSVHILQGSKDTLIPPVNAKRLGQLFPQLHVEELQGVGHEPISETPDRIIATVQRVIQDPLSRANKEQSSCLATNK